jgi:hypothetical protein
MRALGFDVTFEEFDGAHVIPPQVYSKWLTWVTSKRKQFIPGGVGAVEWKSVSGDDVAAVRNDHGLFMAYLFDPTADENNDDAAEFEEGVLAIPEMQTALGSFACLKVDVSGNDALMSALKVKKTPAVVVFRLEAADDGTESIKVVKVLKKAGDARGLMKALAKAAKAVDLKLN